MMPISFMSMALIVLAALTVLWPLIRLFLQHGIKADPDLVLMNLSLHEIIRLKHNFRAAGLLVLGAIALLYTRY